jgi:hypothetical protein
MAPRLNGSAVGKDAETEQLIIAITGLTPTLEQEYDRVTGIRPNERVQSRLDRNNAPKERVKLYAQLMGGVAFPAIVVTEDGIITDGNTREKARGLRGDRFMPAWVLPVKWDEADATMRRKLTILSEALNNRNGLPLDVEERVKYVENLIEDGASDAAISTQVGFPTNRVREIRYEHSADRRLVDLGYQLDQLELSSTQKRAFGKPNALGLTDEIFKGLVDLALHSDMMARDINQLSTTLASTGSDDLRRERLARERQSRAAASRTLNLAGQLRSRLSVLGEHPASVFVEHGADHAAEHLDALKQAIVRLEEVVRAQEAAEIEAPTVTPAQTAMPLEVRPQA